MLPTITLDLRRLLEGAASGPKRSAERPAGETHTFNKERLGAGATERHVPVDDLLAWHAAAGLQPGRPASPVLILYGLTSELVQLTVCGPWVGAALTRVPGRLESGRGHALPNAQPLLYWDGKLLRRVYARPDDATVHGPFVADLEALFGTAVFPADAETLRRLQAGEWADPWHSPVPDVSEREIVLNGEGRRVACAWWKPGKR
ncbi:MAG TPA: hypothetical protein VGA02_05540 [Gemmatimonadales bacterium]